MTGVGPGLGGPTTGTTVPAARCTILPNGVGTSWTYDNGDRLTQIQHYRTTGGTILFQANATYDNVGRQLTQTDFDPARVTGTLPGSPNLLAPIERPDASERWAEPARAHADRRYAGGREPNALAPSRLNASLPATTTQTFQYDAAGRLIQEDRTGFRAPSGRMTTPGTGPARAPGRRRRPTATTATTGRSGRRPGRRRPSSRTTTTAR